MTPTDLTDGSSLGTIAQVVLGLATLVNSVLLWPIVKKLQRNDERQDEEIQSLKKRKRNRR